MNNSKHQSSLIKSLKPFVELFETLDLAPAVESDECPAPPPGLRRPNLKDILFVASGSWSGAHFTKQNAYSIIEGYKQLKEGHSVNQDFLDAVETLVSLYEVWSHDTLNRMKLKDGVIELELYDGSLTPSGYHLTSKDLLGVKHARESIDKKALLRL